MRLARLDLLRYGCFTDASIELPRAARDIHIIFGPNEAGKTTSLTAIEDLLFGIPERSPFNFKHNYGAMRLGAVLEQGDEHFEFQRRKSRKETILGPDGLPMAGDEQLLAPFLGGADRNYFDRMFNLSHSRLAEGGKAIIAAKDDVGQMLFAAGTGLADLRERLKQLEQEADGLWAPRRSKRAYYEAQGRFEDAQRRRRDHSLSVNAWRAARTALDDAETAYQERRQENEDKSTELKKLARIRRIHACVRERAELLQEIAALGDVTVLAEDAVTLLADAEKQDAEVRAEVSVRTPQLDEDRKELGAITFDRALVRRAAEIVDLNEKRIALRGERRDLPKRRDEFRIELESLGRLAGEIGWTFTDAAGLIERVPPRSKVEPVRTLLARHGEVTAELRNGRKAVEETQAALQEQTSLLRETGEAADVSGLAAVLAAVRESGDVAGRMRTAEGQVAEATEEIERKVRVLKPVLAEGADIESIAVPPRDAVVAHRDAVRDLDQRQAENERRLVEARNALQRDRESVAQRVRDEGLVAPEALAEARDYRDVLWELVKARYVDGTEFPAEEAQAYADALDDLPGSFTRAVEQADSVADRRFDQAQAAGELTLLARNIAGHEMLIGQLETAEMKLATERESLDAAWQALWAAVLVEPLAPDVMLAWLEARDGIVALIERQRAAERQLEDGRKEEQTVIAQVQTELSKLGWEAEAVKADSLRVLIERADGFRRQQEANAEKIAGMLEAVRKAKTEVARRQRELEKAQAAQEGWQAKWADAVAALDLQGESKPEVVSARIKVIDDMRDHAASARDLRDKRIATIERDVTAFEGAVAEVVAALAPDLASAEAEKAVLTLDKQREASLTRHQRHTELTKAVAEREKKIAELEESRKACWASVEPLYQAAGVTDVEVLRTAIQRSDRARTLKGKLAAVMETLAQQGDGLAIEALEEECRDVDIDAVQARQEAAEAELKVLVADLEKAVEARTDARRAFEAFGGDDAAARAAADREEARAAMREAAERYVRVRSSGILLRWAIDRYRREKQGPLLKRAGELFRALTRNSFGRLEVGFDETEDVHLMGVRPDGQVVPVPGLSTGAEDQLFLALRVAAIEDYLSRAAALPFVADDLFINFDDGRSAAGFEVLAQLSERTQVLFYAHHEHLVDVARKTLGNDDIHVIHLADV